MIQRQFLDRVLQIEHVPIGRLVPAPTNARKHSPAQIRKIADSIRAFGITTPILRDGDNVVIAGHGRLAAMKLLNIATVPTILLSDLSDAQRRAYAIADNRLTELSSFDTGQLKVEVEFLLESDLTVELTGFDTVEIDRILGHDTAASDGEQVTLPDLEVPAVSRLGDCWQIGEHRVLCGDALALASYEQLLGNRRAGMIFTDPPYNVPIANNVSGLGAKTHREFAMASGEMSASEFTFRFLRPVLRHIVAFSNPGAIAFTCMDWRHTRELQEAADGVFLEHKNTIVWVKSNAGLGSFFRSQHEFILAFKVSAGKHVNNFGLGGKHRHRSNVWQYPGVNVFRPGRMEELTSHPTVKNLRMVADAILDCSKPGDIVLDPFLGSGTTAVAAAITGRVGFGIEIDPHYIDLTLGRIAAKTGLTAMLDDATFAEVARLRSADAGEAR